MGKQAGASCREEEAGSPHILVARTSILYPVVHGRVRHFYGVFVHRCAASRHPPDQRLRLRKKVGMSRSSVLMVRGWKSAVGLLGANAAGSLSRRSAA